MQIPNIRFSTPDVAHGLRQQLQKIVPAAFSDGRLDPLALAQLLGDHAVNDHEPFRLHWPGKRQALAQLRGAELVALDPQKNLSLDFDSAKHALVVGENLRALKALLQNYHQAFKMIYIDPPYNTGNDYFVYEDDFRQSHAHHLAQTQQTDHDNQRIRIQKNTRDNGRFHSLWLNFLYPRLFLARELLRDDGVIFVSIDDNEVHNLRHLLDEDFGEENFVGELIRKTKSTTNDSKTGFNLQHESVLIYAKNKDEASLFGGEKDLSRYSNPDNDPQGPWASDNPSAKTGTEKLRYEIVNPHTGTSDWPPEGRYWQFSKESLEERVKSGQIVFKKTVKPGERGFVFKRYLSQLRTTQRTLDSLAFVDNEYMNQHATKALIKFMETDAFTYPKGTNFVKKLVEHGTSGEGEELVLDFFAGSGTTGHAVMELNAEDGGDRRFVLIQAPVMNGESATARSAGFSDIAQICAERLRRAGKKHGAGFRYFAAVDTHYQPWVPPENVAEAQKLLTDSAGRRPFKPGTPAEDWAWELAYKSGARPRLDCGFGRATVCGATVHLFGTAGVVLEPPTDTGRAFRDGLTALGLKTWIIGDEVFGTNDSGMTNLVMDAEARGIRVETA